MSHPGRRGGATYSAPMGPRAVLDRLRHVVRPDVEVTAAPPGLVIERDVPITVRDGTVLRANVYRPPGPGPFPCVMSAHPYGKDRLPDRAKPASGVSFQYRLFRQPRTTRFSELTTWEAPDPAVWTDEGYAVVNADLRGAGTSEGVGELLSDAEAEDYADLVTWAAAQPWCNGRVGLDGVSYLAISQWKVAGLAPPGLAAICPWEGFTDAYRDFARPGGVREDGFSILWSRVVRRTARVSTDLRAEIIARPLVDDWWRSITPDLEAVEVPMLVCASFSDHLLHSRGSFEAWRRVRSVDKWLHTHRDGKWCHYYSPEATEARRRFFARFLKGEPDATDDLPRVRLAIHETGAAPAEVRAEEEYPPTDLDWTPLHLGADGTLSTGPRPEGTTAFATRGGHLAFAWTVPDDLDLIGPMALHLPVELVGTPDASLFVGVRKFHDGREVTFEGSYGFGGAMVTNGWQTVSHRDLDPDLSTPAAPVHTHDGFRFAAPGEVVAVEVALRDQATRFRAGDVLRLDVQGRWFHPRNPLTGQLPAGYRPSRRGRCVVHCGGPDPARLLVGVRRLGDGPGAGPRAE